MNEITVAGKYGSAKIFTVGGDSAIDGYALHQIRNLCDDLSSRGSKIRVMPDVHPGKVCVIGLSMTVGARVIPEIVGIDIGCGMTAARVRGVRPEYQKLDSVIRGHVPSGSGRRKEIHRLALDFDMTRLCCWRHLRKNADGTAHALLGAGTLGGGNHFIELDKGEGKDTYLIVHSGSRHLGCEVSDWYLKQGHQLLKERGEAVPFEMTYLDGELMDDYIHDLQVVQEFASLNRHIIVQEIVRGMKWKLDDEWECVHNYIDCHDGAAPLLRKGAISARKGERVIVPANMRDGVILGRGTGNEDWNCTAPHGSGRIIRRSDVAKTHTVSEFKGAMRGIYSSCIGKTTLDEAPFAYRPLDEIAAAISPTVSVEQILRPLYSHKAGGEES
ncbi:MAG: RtcB family protein [Treponema sp.]|nr:RtcB family protein [Treponema sp.]MBQ7166619.1 RtcB family protein [Treponema sp.]